MADTAKRKWSTDEVIDAAKAITMALTEPERDEFRKRYAEMTADFRANKTLRVPDDYLALLDEIVPGIASADDISFANVFMAIGMRYLSMLNDLTGLEFRPGMPGSIIHHPTGLSGLYFHQYMPVTNPIDADMNPTQLPYPP